MNKQKICVVASAGGHLSQVLSLQPIWEKREVFFVSTAEVVRGKLQSMGRTYIIDECNHENLIKTLSVLGSCIPIILRERPDVVISTGSAPGFLMCLCGKMFRAKVVWLDSIANAKKLSLSGQIMRFFADLTLSQWPEVAAKYSNVEYAGEVI